MTSRPRHEIIIAAVLVLSVFASDCDISRPETHLIHSGYRGDVYILSGYRSGVAPRREGSAILFLIPPNGILVTRDVLSSGWHENNFFYVDSAGNRTRLRYEATTIPDTPENRADQTPIIWFERRGEIQGNDLPCAITFDQYYVGTPADLLGRSIAQTNAQQLRLEELVRRNHICP